MWNRRVYTVLFLFISVTRTGCVYTLCKDGWIAYRGSCYLFNMNPMQFTTAEQYCRQHDNSHLVHVDDATENSFLKDRMRMFKDSDWWVGITDEEVEGVWKWFDTDDVATFTDFVPGDGGDHKAEDCAVFVYGADYVWADFLCSVSKSVLCEIRGHGEAEIVG